MSDLYAMDQDDVGVEDLEPTECEQCAEPATKTVCLDIRAIGEKAVLGVYCEEHAQEMADRLRRGLPPPREEQG